MPFFAYSTFVSTVALSCHMRTKAEKRSNLMEISFKDITRIIKKNIVFIAVLSLLCAAASYFVTTFLVQKTYTSTVKLYVETNYKSQSAYDDYQSINYAKNLVLTYIELLDSNSFYNSVSKELNEKYTASQLKSMIKFESIEDTEVFKALVNSGSPSEGHWPSELLLTVKIAEVTFIGKVFGKGRKFSAKTETRTGNAPPPSPTGKRRFNGSTDSDIPPRPNRPSWRRGASACTDRKARASRPAVHHGKRESKPRFRLRNGT